MKNLSYQTLKEQNYSGYLLENAPVKVLQFGEGNFLRAFVDAFIDEMNEKANFNGKVTLVQPIAPGLASMINEQQGLYTLMLRGSENGETVDKKRVISCVESCINPYENYALFLEQAKNPDLRFLVSNTTEAGIAFDPECKLNDTPPASFPAKLTAFLYERYKNGGKGFIILSCELIDYNGAKLKECVEQYIELWKLDDDFLKWVGEQNAFCSTLVDRIVTGYPRSEAETLCEQFGYKDNLIDTAEPFGFWVIEGPQSIKEEFPFEKAGLPILVVDDHRPYKQRKVRILNGAHTSLIMAAYLAGKDIVRDCMQDEVLSKFLEKTIYSEIIPTLDLPESELKEFASSVKARFENPFIDHSLLAISLNSCSKWKARVMPSLTEYYNRKNKLPECIVFSFAAFIAFYHNGKELSENALVAKRGDDTYQIQDDKWVLDFFFALKDKPLEQVAKSVISNKEMWGDELVKLDGFEQAVVKALENIEQKGMYKAIEELI